MKRQTMMVKAASIRKERAARAYYRYISNVERTLDLIEARMRAERLLEQRARIPAGESDAGRFWTFR